MQGTITKRSVDRLQPGQILADNKLTGFVVRKMASGRPTFGFRYSLDGKRHWLSIGIGIAPEAARKAALAHAGSVARDISPVSVREARRAKARAGRSVSDILDGYLKAKVAGQRSEGEVVSMVDRLIRPRLGKRPVDALRRLEIVELLDAVADDKGKRTSDKVLSVLRSAFNWYALRNDEFRTPIVAGMNRLSIKDLVRDRILSDDEIRSVWSALDGFQPESYSRLVRCLLLTACRRRELGDLQGHEIADGVITVPAARVKTATDHVIPLTPALANLLGTGDGSRFSTEGGVMPFSDFSRAKLRLDGAIAEQRKRDGLAPMPGWRLHDLRRTARTLMSRAGVQNDIAERVLGHALVGVRGVYDHHNYLQEKREALTRLQALVESIVAAPTATSSEIAAADVSGH